MLTGRKDLYLEQKVKDQVGNDLGKKTSLEEVLDRGVVFHLLYPVNIYVEEIIGKCKKGKGVCFCGKSRFADDIVC